MIGRATATSRSFIIPIDTTARAKPSTSRNMNAIAEAMSFRWKSCGSTFTCPKSKMHTSAVPSEARRTIKLPGWGSDWNTPSTKNIFAYARIIFWMMSWVSSSASRTAAASVILMPSK